jgi:hypothetical protein
MMESLLCGRATSGEDFSLVRRAPLTLHLGQDTSNAFLEYPSEIQQVRSAILELLG